MKTIEIVAVIAFVLGYGCHYIYADDQRIERESGVAVVSK